MLGGHMRSQSIMSISRARPSILDIRCSLSLCILTIQTQPLRHQRHSLHCLQNPRFHAPFASLSTRCSHSPLSSVATTHHGGNGLQPVPTSHTRMFSGNHKSKSVIFKEKADERERRRAAKESGDFDPAQWSARSSARSSDHIRQMPLHEWRRFEEVRRLEADFENDLELEVALQQRKPGWVRRQELKEQSGSGTSPVPGRKPGWIRRRDGHLNEARQLPAKWSQLAKRVNEQKASGSIVLDARKPSHRQNDDEIGRMTPTQTESDAPSLPSRKLGERIWGRGTDEFSNVVPAYQNSNFTAQEEPSEVSSNSPLMNTKFSVRTHFARPPPSRQYPRRPLLRKRLLRTPPPKIRRRGFDWHEARKRKNPTKPINTRDPEFQDDFWVQDVDADLPKAENARRYYDFDTELLDDFTRTTANSPATLTNTWGSLRQTREEKTLNVRDSVSESGPNNSFARSKMNEVATARPAESTLAAATALDLAPRSKASLRRENRIHNQHERRRMANLGGIDLLDVATEASPPSSIISQETAPDTTDASPKPSKPPASVQAIATTALNRSTQKTVQATAMNADSSASNKTNETSMSQKALAKEEKKALKREEKRILKERIREDMLRLREIEGDETEAAPPHESLQPETTPSGNSTAAEINFHQPDESIKTQTATHESLIARKYEKLRALIKQMHHPLPTLTEKEVKKKYREFLTDVHIASLPHGFLMSNKEKKGLRKNFTSEAWYSVRAQLRQDSEGVQTAISRSPEDEKENLESEEKNELETAFRGTHTGEAINPPVMGTIESRPESHGEIKARMQGRDPTPKVKPVEPPNLQVEDMVSEREQFESSKPQTHEKRLKSKKRQKKLKEYAAAQAARESERDKKMLEAEIEAEAEGFDTRPDEKFRISAMVEAQQTQIEEIDTAGEEAELPNSQIDEIPTSAEEVEQEEFQTDETSAAIVEPERESPMSEAMEDEDTLTASADARQRNNQAAMKESSERQPIVDKNTDTSSPESPEDLPAGAVLTADGKSYRLNGKYYSRRISAKALAGKAKRKAKRQRTKEHRAFRMEKHKDRIDEMIKQDPNLTRLQALTKIHWERVNARRDGKKKQQGLALQEVFNVAEVEGHSARKIRNMAVRIKRGEHIPEAKYMNALEKVSDLTRAAEDQSHLFTDVPDAKELTIRRTATHDIPGSNSHPPRDTDTPSTEISDQSSDSNTSLPDLTTPSQNPQASDPDTHLDTQFQNTVPDDLSRTPANLALLDEQAKWEAKRLKTPDRDAMREHRLALKRNRVVKKWGGHVDPEVEGLQAFFKAEEEGERGVREGVDVTDEREVRGSGLRGLLDVKGDRDGKIGLKKGGKVKEPWKMKMEKRRERSRGEKFVKSKRKRREEFDSDLDSSEEKSWMGKRREAVGSNVKWGRETEGDLERPWEKMRESTRRARPMFKVPKGYQRGYGGSPVPRNSRRG